MLKLIILLSFLLPFAYASNAIGQTPPSVLDCLNQANHTCVIDMALTTANEIEFDHVRLYALTAIAQAQAKLEKKDDAYRTFKRVLTTMDKIEEPYTKVTTLIFIARTQVKLGEKDNANHTLKQAQSATNNIQNPKLKLTALQLIANIQSEIDNANHTLKQAQSATNNIQNPKLKLTALQLIANIQSEIDNELNTKILNVYDLYEFKNKPWLFGNPIKDAKRYCLIARKQASIGNSIGVKKAFEQALAATEKIENTVYKNLVLQAIAHTQNKLGYQAEGLATANKISLTIFKDRTLRNIARLKDKNDNTIKSLSLTEIIEILFLYTVNIKIQRLNNNQRFNILEADKKAETLYNYADILVFDAHTQAKTGNINKANHRIKRALAITNEATDKLIKVQAFSAIALALAKRN